MCWLICLLLSTLSLRFMVIPSLVRPEYWKGDVDWYKCHSMKQRKCTKRWTLMKIDLFWEDRTIIQQQEGKFVILFVLKIDIRISCFIVPLWKEHQTQIWTNLLHQHWRIRQIICLSVWCLCFCHSILILKFIWQGSNFQQNLGTPHRCSGSSDSHIGHMQALWTKKFSEAAINKIQYP